MLTLASHSETVVPAAPHRTVQSAHFDIALASADAGGPVELVAGGLLSFNNSTALLNCCNHGETGSAATPHSKVSPGTATHMEIVLPSASRNTNTTRPDARCPDAVLYAAMKLLCFDDRLFDLEGGCDFVRTSVSAARRAGRMTALFCTDARTQFMKRREIADSFGGNFDVIVGEPAAVLSLFGVRRIDTLVPKMMQHGIGLILHRTDFPPICLKPRSTAVEIGKSPISATSFWAEFVPAALDELIRPERTQPEPCRDRPPAVSDCPHAC